MWDNVRSIRPRQRPTISVVNYVPVTLRPSNRVRLGGPLMASPFPPSFLFWPWPFTAFASFTGFGLSVSLSSLGTKSITSFIPFFRLCAWLPFSPPQSQSFHLSLTFFIFVFTHAPFSFFSSLCCHHHHHYTPHTTHHLTSYLYHTFEPDFR